MISHAHDHKEHILPLKVYFAVFGALLVLTAVTVIISKFHFGAFNLVVAMAVAAVKASLVALYFMHLKYDSKVYMTVFLIAIAMLAVFIILTMADTLTRGRLDPQKEQPITPSAVIYREDTVAGAPVADSTALDSAAAGERTAADTSSAGH